MKDVIAYLEKNRRNYAAFFRGSRAGDMLVFASCWRPASLDSELGEWRSKNTSHDPVIQIPAPMTEDFLKRHAYELGVEAVRVARLISEFHCECVHDDYSPGIIFHPGAGYQAAMSSGGDVSFAISPDGKGASYTSTRVILDWDTMEEAFHHDNRWLRYAIEFWRGVESKNIEGLTVTPRYNRSPLDLAWDLRGDQIFYDLLDYPHEVDHLLNLCAQSIIEIDKVLRAESRVLREAPGGALGVAFGHPTMILNGDPLDLISGDMVRRFNNPSMEIVTRYAEASILHHHSIGISKSSVVNEIGGLSLQEISQDPNGPRIADSIDTTLIEDSLIHPLFLEFPIFNVAGSLDELAEKLSRGRFIVHLYVRDPDETKTYVDKLRAVTATG
jgi:hypothetical protein